MNGTELRIQQPGSPFAQRLFVGYLPGVSDPVIAFLTDAGPRILGVMVDEDAGNALLEAIVQLEDAAISVHDVQGGESDL